jgi:mannose-6-phosphate isomerase-like protein (cupin superfamily)
MGFPDPQHSSTPIFHHSSLSLFDNQTRLGIGSARSILTGEAEMEFLNLSHKIEEARKQKIRNSHFFGTDNFRSWMLYFEPGDETPMHFHQNPESFLVVQGQCSVKDLKGGERIFEKNDILFIGAKEYYQLINNGSEPLVLFGNRSEPFGIGITRAAEGK